MTRQKVDIDHKNSIASNEERIENVEPSPFLEAIRMLSHITTAIVLMLICGGIGYGIDHYLAVKGVSLIGFLGGGTLAVKHLIAVTSPTTSRKKQESDIERKA